MEITSEMQNAGKMAQNVIVIKSYGSSAISFCFQQPRLDFYCWLHQQISSSMQACFSLWIYEPKRQERERNITKVASHHVGKPLLFYCNCPSIPNTHWQSVKYFSVIPKENIVNEDRKLDPINSLKLRMWIEQADLLLKSC